ncbi:hypothetical protein ES707_10326 [subsurface metagenome]
MNFEKFEVLDIIAVEVLNSNHGDFLKCFAGAWQRADLSNKRILLEPWKQLISKYKFREEYAEAIKRELK